MPDAPATVPCPWAIGETDVQTLVFDEPSIRVFATMSGDANPMHHDADFAATTRFGGLIASAGHYSAQMMGAVATWLSQRTGSLGLEFTFQFSKAVLVDSVMTLEWRITDILLKPSLKGHIVSMEGALRQADGVVAVVATCKGLILPLKLLQTVAGTQAVGM